MNPSLPQRPMTPAAPRSHGFTLVELMIVVAIVAILATIALPSYRSYVLRSKRAVAKAAINEIAQKEESYSVDHKQYTGNLNLLGYTGSPIYLSSEGNTSASSSTDSIYKLEVTPASADDFTVVATAINAQAGDSACPQLNLRQSGEKQVSGSNTPAIVKTCWGR